jgi:hypothetical protein
MAKTSGSNKNRILSGLSAADKDLLNLKPVALPLRRSEAPNKQSRTIFHYLWLLDCRSEQS